MKTVSVRFLFVLASKNGDSIVSTLKAMDNTIENTRRKIKYCLVDRLFFFFLLNNKSMQQVEQVIQNILPASCHLDCLQQDAYKKGTGKGKEKNHNDRSLKMKISTQDQGEPQQQRQRLDDIILLSFFSLSKSSFFPH